jgi:hypothetical protein
MIETMMTLLTGGLLASALSAALTKANTLYSTQHPPRRRRHGRGYQERMHGCPTCGTILNGVYSTEGNAATRRTIFLCPKAIGEQLPNGLGGHYFPAGSQHWRLIFWVEVSGKLEEYKSNTGKDYAQLYRKGLEDV